SPDYEPSLPVSEKSNPLTRDIDRASANGIRLLSKQVVETLMEVAKKVECILKDPRDSVVVLSGCGTSGRLAFLITVCEGKKRVLFIGISCGLSAPFVAGQLDLCLQHPEVYTPVLVGFNPTHQARDESIPGCRFTFRSVVQRMQELTKSQKAFIINPVVGPEAISGSSRMKGGSATKILLEVILSAAHAATFTSTPITYKGILQYMRAYEKSLDVTFAQKEGISALLEAAGRSLQCGRRVCYLGWGSLATLGLIDASECIPTFGADYNDVRGFISGGYRELNNNEGPLVCERKQWINIYDVSEVAKLARSVREKTSNLHAVCHRVDGDTAAAVQQEDINKLCLSSLKIPWSSPASGILAHLQWELSTKLLLNAVSTGAHVLKGKIYQNYMIDVQVTNSKLYCRATRLLQNLSGCPESQCEEALLKTIYRVDKLTADITPSDISTHTRTARNRTKVRRLWGGPSGFGLFADRLLSQGCRDSFGATANRKGGCRGVPVIIDMASS
ncbi:hypothetical protein FQN60_006655, partial [Etheostoma spectabile]